MRRCAQRRSPGCCSSVPGCCHESSSRRCSDCCVAGHLVAPTAPVTIPLTPGLYTTTPRYRDFIAADRFRLLTATAQFFWETARLDRRRQDAAARLRLPLLVLQGENDAMMDVAGTRDWFRGLAVTDKTYRSYPSAGHTLDFETDRSRYLADVLGWLSTRSSAGTPRLVRP